MASRLASSNKGNSKDLFKQRIRYRQYIAKYKKKHRNIVDFNLGEKTFYGRMNYDEVAIGFARTSLSALRSITASHRTSSPCQALNFVAEAFDAMVRHFEQCANAGLIRADDPYLSQPLAYKAFEDPFVKFEEVREAYKKALRKKFKRNQIECLSVDQFLPHFIRESSIAAGTVPLTYPGFIKSRHCNVLHTGLAIEIADIKCSDDISKFADFVSSPNWPFFVQTCNDFGFMIDLNIPWRLVADISRPAMAARESRYNTPGPMALFSMYYNLAARDYYQLLTADILGYYNATRRKRVRVRTPCANGSSIYKSASPARYTEMDLLSQLSHVKRISVYCALRLAEEKPTMPTSVREQIIDDCLGVYKATHSIGGAIENFERFISKTFDKRGSFSYLSTAIPAQIREQRHRRRNKDGSRLDHEEPNGGGY